MHDLRCEESIMFPLVDTMDEEICEGIITLHSVVMAIVSIVVLLCQETIMWQSEVLPEIV